MAAHGFKQESHKLLVIPGPIEVHDDVLFANAHPSMSHVSADFIPVFGDCIRMIKQVLYAPAAQPFLIAGSGTLGWDQVASNLVEPGEHALVLHTGYFGDSFAECLEVYGARATQLKAPVGGVCAPADVEAALKERKYKLVTITHVDTSTGVLSDAKAIAETVRRVSPDTLIVLDAVCSVASEEIQMEAWGIDVVISASQKGLGTPPGLSVLCASPRAIKVWETRTAPPSSYYASWKKWLPIMRAYEAGTPAYFATPPVQLIYAFRESLAQLTQGTPSLEERFAMHKAAAQKVRAAGAALGLTPIGREPGLCANGMSALYFPAGIAAGDIVPRLAQRGVIIAAGLHKDIKDKYFRIGHMGVTVTDPSRGDVERIISGLEEAFAEARASKNA